MTEMSYAWGGIATGDAQTALGGAPYSDDEWADIWSFLLQYDRTLQGPIDTGRSGYTGDLEVTNPAGTTIRVATGAAIVDGRLYTNDANVDNDVDLGGTGYYNVVLRKHEADQEVRIALLGPQVGVPAVTQSAAVWEISIGTFHFDDGTNTVSVLTDTRVFAIHPSSWLSDRQGNSADEWVSPGTTDYKPKHVRIQCGAIQLPAIAAGNYDDVTVTYPWAYPSYRPLLYYNIIADDDKDLFTVISATASTGFVIGVQNDSAGSLTPTIAWMTIGPEAL